MTDTPADFAQVASKYAATFGNALVLDCPGVGFIVRGDHGGGRHALPVTLATTSPVPVPVRFDPSRCLPSRVFELHRREVLGPNAGPHATDWRHWQGTAFVFRVEDVEALLQRAREEGRLP